MAMGFVALIAFLHNPVSNAIKRFYAFLAGVAILWSVGVAGRHVWLQHLPPDQVPSCGPGLNYLIDALPMKTVLQEVLSGSGECAAIDWTFFRSVFTSLVIGLFPFTIIGLFMAVIPFYPVFKTAKK